MKGRDRGIKKQWEMDLETRYTDAEVAALIAIHTAIAAAHQDEITLDANADTLLALTGQALGLDTQTANTIQAGPASGAAAVPTFRALVIADIPATHGHCYGNEIAWAQASAVQNTWYNVSDADMVSGPLNNVAHDGNGQLTVLTAGKYNIDWSGAFEASGAGVHVQVTVSVNGTADVSATNHFQTVAATRQLPCSGFTILSLAVNDTVELAMRTTDAGTPNLGIDHLMLRVTMVGG